MNNRGTYKLATIGGINVNFHWGWLLVLLLITYQLASLNFPSEMPGESTILYWVLGFVSALLLFVSVLLHEFSHSFLARARGYKVHDITLFIFGGVSNIEEEARSALDEFLIAVVGPLTSFILAIVFFGLFQVVTPPLHTAGAGAAAILRYLAIINLLLAVFNMIPGFPLDGGRVLRAIIWGISRNADTATRAAGFVGQLVAYAFMLYGLFTVLQGELLSGIWIGFIGWFLLNAAQQTTAGVSVRRMLKGVTVGQVMQAPPPAAAPHITIAHLLTQYMLPSNAGTVPVLGEDGRLVGIVTLAEIRDVPQDQWGIVTVAQVMTGPDKLRVASSQDGLDRALELLNDGEVDQLPVVDPQGKLVGMLSKAHLLRWMQIRDELNIKPPQQGRSDSQPTAPSN